MRRGGALVSGQADNGLRPFTSVDATQLDWAKSALLPAIVQHSDNGHVLMLGYMNRAALEQTCASGLVTFFSRSRQTLWTKGETSGHHLRLTDIRADCDNDTLLVRARPVGPTCHRGTTSCFDTPPPSDPLGELATTIDARLTDGSADSYVATLARDGVTRLAQKVGEEAVEVAIAAVAGRRDETVSETADLLFHLLLLLRHEGISLDEVFAELEARRKPAPEPQQSGH
jgi:phosphoribosyl-ATP pyrophosphohydrolase/phosphoribosyl-AMP cyclohydrolase